ncbi:MAG: glycosyltransferase [Verrucomicrobia bacterium]|nr:glycosyltransferase [Verrucomicrobiota bacterium]
MNLLVTIAIPTYHRLTYLQEAVASAQAQTYAPIEILVGDDGPTVEIGAWCRAVMRQDPRVRYQRNPRNLGLAGNWNALANAAHGEFTAIIGDDDRLLPEFAGRLAAALEPQGDVAFANHYLISERGARLEAESRQHTREFRRDRLPAGLLANAEGWIWQNVVPMSASLSRTDNLRRLRFKEDLNTPEIELFLRLAQAGGKFVFVPDYLAEYRAHPDSATAAGLWGERLAEYLLPMPATPPVEPFKRQFMARLLVGAVSRCLLAGERERARRFLRSGYFPASPRARVWLQSLCTWLPTAVGTGLYRAAHRFRRPFP